MMHNEDELETPIGFKMYSVGDMTKALMWGLGYHYLMPDERAKPLWGATVRHRDELISRKEVFEPAAYKAAWEHLLLYG